MAYTLENFKTKKAMLAALRALGKLEAFQPGGMFPLKEGNVTIEGPHYPQPHRWYASGIVKDGYLIAAK